MALQVDGPNIEPALSPYPPCTRPAVLAGNPPRSLHPRPRPALQMCLAGSPPRPVGCGTRGAGRGGTARADLSFFKKMDKSDRVT